LARLLLALVVDHLTSSPASQLQSFIADVNTTMKRSLLKLLLSCSSKGQSSQATSQVSDLQTGDHVAEVSYPHQSDADALSPAGRDAQLHSAAELDAGLLASAEIDVANTRYVYDGIYALERLPEHLLLKLAPYITRDDLTSLKATSKVIEDVFRPTKSRLGHLRDLPNEVLCKIVSFVPADDLANVKSISRFMNDLVQQNKTFIANMMMESRFSFLVSKIMPHHVLNIKEGELQAAKERNPDWFNANDVADRLGVCTCRECEAKTETMILSLEWWQQTKDLRADFAARTAAHALAATSLPAKGTTKPNAVWSGIRYSMVVRGTRANLSNFPRRFLRKFIKGLSSTPSPLTHSVAHHAGSTAIPSTAARPTPAAAYYAPAHWAGYDGHYRVGLRDYRRFDRFELFPSSPMEWIYFLNRLNTMLLLKVHWEDYLTCCIGSDRCIRAKYEQEQEMLAKEGWDGKSSLVDFCFEQVGLAGGPYRLYPTFENKVRTVWNGMKLSMFFEYIGNGPTHEEIFGEDCGSRDHSSRMLIF
jgi:hypothetical protein